MDIVERLRFDAARCEVDYSKGVAGNIEEAADEIERLRAALKPFAVAGLSQSVKNNDLDGALARLTIADLQDAAKAFCVEQHARPDGPIAGKDQT